jgi:predicted AAA+ superfamily ATPase
MNKLIAKYKEKIARLSLTTTRRYIEYIDWSDRLIGIRGSRGVGKTTLILHYLKRKYKTSDKALYVSLDDIYFTENKLYYLAERFYKSGGETLVLDEVHKYPNWAIEVKNIYDDFFDLQVIFSGSSLLQLQKSKADLSRRAVIYNMPGLSFREFLNFELKEDFKSYSLDEIINNHVEICSEIISRVKPLEFFSKYLNYGYFPFYLENKKTYHLRLNETILTVLEVDLPQVTNINVANIRSMKKLLSIISSAVPFKPNLTSLSQRSDISINTLKAYLQYLRQAELIIMLPKKGKSLNSMSKAEKVFLHNSNMMYTLADENANIGNIRETFFANQFSHFHEITAPEYGDFLIDDKYTFEIGGKSKSRKQIIDIENAFVVKDDIEIGYKNDLPLWLFGFMY